MVYFQNMALVFGVMMGLAAFWIIFFPDSYRKYAEVFLPEKRPSWYVWLSVPMIAWIGYTWVRFFGFQNPVSLAISAMFSLSLIKMYMFVFRYGDFRNMANSLISSNSVIKLFGVIYLALAMALLGMGMAL